MFSKTLIILFGVLLHVPLLFSLPQPAVREEVIGHIAVGLVQGNPPGNGVWVPVFYDLTRQN
jgi:hypothetical protein